VPTNGLVLYLPLNGNTNDSSSYASNGFNNGATPVSDRFGNSKKAMYFNGSSYISILGYTSLNLTQDKTISCWVYLPSTLTMNNYPTLIHKDEPLMSTTYSICLTNDAGYYSNQYKFDFYYASSTTHYQAYTKQLYTNYKDQWLNIVGVYDHTSGYSKIYFNGILSDSTYVGNRISNSSNLNLYIGCGKSNNSNTYFKGYMDDVRIYNRPITKSEVISLFLEKNICSNSTKNDTTTYYVSSEEFKSISPRFQFIKTDSLKTKVGGCDSVINRYARFEYNPKICTVTNSISVTDTLIIKVNISGILPVSTTQNTIKIYPNPAKDYVVINFGDYSKMAGYLMVIRNELGRAVYFTPILQESAYLDIKSWGGNGVYIVQLFDSQSTLVDTRKIIVK
jgi:hypothetical protein